MQEFETKLNLRPLLSASNIFRDINYYVEYGRVENDQFISWGEVPLDIDPNKVGDVVFGLREPSYANPDLEHTIEFDIGSEQFSETYIPDNTSLQQAVNDIVFDFSDFNVEVNNIDINNTNVIFKPKDESNISLEGTEINYGLHQAGEYIMQGSDTVESEAPFFGNVQQVFKEAFGIQSDFEFNQGEEDPDFQETNILRFRLKRNNGVITEFDFPEVLVHYPTYIQIHTDPIQDGDKSSATLSAPDPGTYDSDANQLITLHNNTTGEGATVSFDPAEAGFDWQDVLMDLANAADFADFDVDYTGTDELTVTAKLVGSEFDGSEFEVVVDEWIEPSFYTDAVFRLDASALQDSGYVEGDDVTAWNDLTNNSTESFDGTATFTESAGGSGFPGVNMDGTTFSYDFAAQSNYTVLAIGYYRTDQSWLFDSINGNSPRVLVGDDNNNDIISIYNGDNWISYDGLVNARDVFASVLAGNSPQRLIINSEDKNITSWSGGDGEIGSIGFGDNHSRSQAIVTELVVIPRDLTSQEIQDWKDYIAKRYGIS